MQDRRKQYESTLKAQRRRIDRIMARVAKGHSMGTIAADLGISRQRVGQIVKAEKGKGEWQEK